MTVAEADGGLRAWYTDGSLSIAANAGDFYANALLKNFSVDSSTGVLAESTEVRRAYYLYAVVDNGTILDMPSGSRVIFKSMPSVVQITEATEATESTIMPLLDGNGGQWADGQTKRTPYLSGLGKTLDAWTSENTPTKS